MISSGIRDMHLKIISEYYNWPNKYIVAAIDDNESVLGFCLQEFTVSMSSWAIRCCYIAHREGETQYNASKIGGKILEAMCDHAETLGVTKFFYVVRDIGTKRLNMTLNASEHLKDKYDIKDLEYIAPLTKSNNEIVNTWLLIDVAGKNTKPLIIRGGFLKE